MLKKGTLASPGDGLGEQRLAGARRADQQQAARNASAELLEFLRVLQEVDDLLDLFLGLVAAGDVGEGDLVVVLVEHARLALAEAEGAALAAALHLAHEVDPDPDQQQHRPPADQQGHQQRTFLARLDVELDVVADEVADQSAVQVGGGGADLPVIGRDGDDFGAALSFLDHGVLDALVAHLLQEVRVAHHAGTGGAARVELLEHRKQHERDHQPYRDLGKPLIVQLLLRGIVQVQLTSILGVSRRGMMYFGYHCHRSAAQGVVSPGPQRLSSRCRRGRFPMTCPGTPWV